MEMMAPYFYYDMQSRTVQQRFAQDEDIPSVLQAKLKELSTGPVKNYVTQICSLSISTLFVFYKVYMAVTYFTSYIYLIPSSNEELLHRGLL